jgi:hypothetical protein
MTGRTEGPTDTFHLEHPELRHNLWCTNERQYWRDIFIPTELELEDTQEVLQNMSYALYILNNSGRH